ncbi:MAG: adaptor protein MecA [Clostridia bacterium]|nr:adaptor protein MecA [Clostridia bacterium]
MKTCRPRRDRVKVMKVLDFADFDALAGCAAMLYRRYKGAIRGRLYRIPEGYRLLVTVNPRTDLTACREFGRLQSASCLSESYAEEYGELLISERAVQKIGRAFVSSVRRQEFKEF